MTEIYFYGRLADLAGERKMTLALMNDPSTIADVVASLEELNADLGDALHGSKVRYVLNDEVADIDAAVRGNDMLAFLPPVSGG